LLVITLEMASALTSASADRVDVVEIEAVMYAPFCLTRAWTSMPGALYTLATLPCQALRATIPIGTASGGLKALNVPLSAQ
jgi:hypothetical protein